MLRNVVLLASLLALGLIGTGSPGTAQEASAITMGNGDANWITVEGVTRDGNALTFDEVRIAGNGWLVIHPFQDGRPNGDRVVGVTGVEDGTNTDVRIEVPKGLDPGERMIVMLHRDSNDNGDFDFIFVDDRNVMDRAVFEGTKMIGHVIAAP